MEVGVKERIELQKKSPPLEINSTIFKTKMQILMLILVISLSLSTSKMLIQVKNIFSSSSFATQETEISQRSYQLDFF